MEKSDHNHSTSRRCQTRRDFFRLVSDGIYGTALTYLLCQDLYGGTEKLVAEATPGMGPGRRRVYNLKPRSPQFEPKAKAVIQLLMNGAPSQMDLFDPKPALEKHRGDSFVDKAATEVTSTADQRGLLPSPFKFAQRGKSGIWLSEVMPHLAEV